MKASHSFARRASRPIIFQNHPTSSIFPPYLASPLPSSLSTSSISTVPPRSTATLTSTRRKRSSSLSSRRPISLSPISSPASRSSSSLNSIWSTLTSSSCSRSSTASWSTTIPTCSSRASRLYATNSSGSDDTGDTTNNPSHSGSTPTTPTTPTTSTSAVRPGGTSSTTTTTTTTGTSSISQISLEALQSLFSKKRPTAPTPTPSTAVTTKTVSADDAGAGAGAAEGGEGATTQLVPSEKPRQVNAEDIITQLFGEDKDLPKYLDEVKAALDRKLVIFINGTPEKPTCHRSYALAKAFTSENARFVAFDVEAQPNYLKALRCINPLAEVPAAYLDNRWLDCWDVIELGHHEKLDATLRIVGVKEDIPYLRILGMVGRP